MNDNDLIRRGDAIAMLTNLPIYFEYDSDAESLRAEFMIQMAQRRLSALPAADPAPAIVSGPVGPDWQPARPSESFYAQAPCLPDGRPGPFAFGPSEEAARAALARKMDEAHWPLTNEELDKLVEQQTRAANKRDEFEALMNADRTVRAITALRAQLADARENARWAYVQAALEDNQEALTEANARADRAEAALAAIDPAPVTLAEAARVLLADKAALATLVDVAEEEHDKGVSFGAVIGRALRAVERSEA